MNIRTPLGVLVAVLATSLAAAAQPATTSPSGNADAVANLPKPVAPMAIKGFRSARFGMKEAQVRAAIRNDFGANAKLSTAANAGEGTTALTVALASLDPGPGPAQVTYIFGASSKELIHVNVAWISADKPADAERSAMVRAGVELMAYFKSQFARPKAAAAGAASGVNGVVLYAAVDDAGASVEVKLDGVALARTVDDKTVASPKPAGPASLVISYARNALHPDIKTIRTGAF